MITSRKPGIYGRRAANIAIGRASLHHRPISESASAPSALPVKIAVSMVERVVACSSNCERRMLSDVRPLGPPMSRVGEAEAWRVTASASLKTCLIPRCATLPGPCTEREFQDCSRSDSVVVVAQSLAAIAQPVEAAKARYLRQEPREDGDIVCHVVLAVPLFHVGRLGPKSGWSFLSVEPEICLGKTKEQLVI